jgi:hypothetical protein
MPTKPAKVLTQTDRRIIRIAAATKMSRQQIRLLFDGVDALMSKHMGKKVKGEIVGPGLLVFNEITKSPTKAHKRSNRRKPGRQVGKGRASKGPKRSVAK